MAFCWSHRRRDQLSEATDSQPRIYRDIIRDKRCTTAIRVQVRPHRLPVDPPQVLKGRPVPFVEQESFKILVPSGTFLTLLSCTVFFRTRDDSSLTVLFSSSLRKMALRRSLWLHSNNTVAQVSWQNISSHLLGACVSSCR
ncbi:uncharacterized protein FOMMEDRAFT_21160 [Fomitiporia mediterranea MF3/22]|uniref:uncharacterized protein n=1 Tax=Fomitiporia mediterranea (strain MF3/22) TaxID=694068 RepID=UPI0004409551|nr:uncharacterized protein FOMMEDRAFT_21160 [Fomitiporia mediterranea MF3/22]EJD02435.1 hypothetical protein FOMMEDRAFT_21160 [Fomitiporia mediterranea MF3/22]